MFYAALAQSAPTVNSLPVAAHVLAVIGLGCGLVLWLIGERMIKPVFGLLGLVLGGLTGFLTLPSLTAETVFGFPSPYVGLGVGGLFGLGAGLLLFRFAVAVSTGLALGIAGILIGAAAINFQPIQNASKNFQDMKNTAAIRAGEVPFDPNATKQQQITTRLKPVAQTVREFVQAQADDVKAAWNSLNGHDQVVLGLSGVGGAVAGIFIGLFFPRKSSAVATALFGSAVWIPSLVWIIQALELPGRQHLDRGVVFWLTAWMVVAIIGLAVQVSGQRKKKSGAQ